MKDILTLILAGGKGTRLEPLTRDRAKPAVPFGGLYRIVDFPLSNCLNSGLRKIMVLTQYKARSLDRHLAAGWNFLPRELDEYVEVLPPQQRIDHHWYRGTADAIYQNIYTIEKADPRYVLILAGDHVYKMDYGVMLREHIDRGADLTIGCVIAPRKEGSSFGIMDVDRQDRVKGFLEKPSEPPGLPDDPEKCLASMGIYVFTADVMYELLCEDAARPGSGHDFGHHIIPHILDRRKVYAHRFLDRNQKPEAYWRDVGTLDAYYQANMDLIAVDPVLNLYDRDWPLRTNQPQLPPPKFVHNDVVEGRIRRGEALNSLVCQGSIVSGGRVSGSVLSPNVRVNSFATVKDSILFERVDVGRRSRITRAIVDKDVKIPEDTIIGENPEDDRRRGFHVSESGLVVITRAEALEAFAHKPAR